MFELKESSCFSLTVIFICISFFITVPRMALVVPLCWFFCSGAPRREVPSYFEFGFVFLCRIFELVFYGLHRVYLKHHVAFELSDRSIMYWAVTWLYVCLNINYGC